MIWTGSEQELLDFMSDLNEKHPCIKFKFKYSLTKIEFLDALFYKGHINMLQTTIQRKPTDRQNYLDYQNYQNYHELYILNNLFDCKSKVIRLIIHHKAFRKQNTYVIREL